MTIKYFKGSPLFKRGVLTRHKWKCDICGKVDFWNSNWTRYGSMNHEENCLGDMPAACSDECLNKLMEKIEKHEFVLPTLQDRGYYSDIKYPRRGY